MYISRLYTVVNDLFLLLFSFKCFYPSSIWLRKAIGLSKYNQSLIIIINTVPEMVDFVNVSIRLSFPRCDKEY